MNDKEKVDLADYIIQYMQERVTSNDMPIMVGTLNTPTGINGFKPAEVGHPVFEYKEKYIIYLERNDGAMTSIIPYRKESLKPHINFVVNF